MKEEIGDKSTLQIDISIIDNSENNNNEEIKWMFEQRNVGLALCKQICKSFGGTLSHNTSHLGNHFRFTMNVLPLTDQQLAAMVLKTSSSLIKSIDSE